MLRTYFTPIKDTHSNIESLARYSGQFMVEIDDDNKVYFDYESPYEDETTRYELINVFSDSQKPVTDISVIKKTNSMDFKISTNNYFYQMAVPLTEFTMLQGSFTASSSTLGQNPTYTIGISDPAFTQYDAICLEFHLVSSMSYTLPIQPMSIVYDDTNMLLTVTYPPYDTDFYTSNYNGSTLTCSVRTKSRYWNCYEPWE